MDGLDGERRDGRDGGSKWVVAGGVDDEVPVCEGGNVKRLFRDYIDMETEC